MNLQRQKNKNGLARLGCKEQDRKFGPEGIQRTHNSPIQEIVASNGPLTLCSAAPSWILSSFKNGLLHLLPFDLYVISVSSGQVNEDQDCEWTCLSAPCD